MSFAAASAADSGSSWSLPASQPRTAGVSYEVEAVWHVGQGGSTWVTGLAVDPDGNVHVSGSTEGDFAAPNAGGRDAFLGSYSLNGELRRAQQFGTEFSEYGVAVDVDREGNVYLVTEWSERWSASLSVLSLTASGEQRWEVVVGPNWGLGASGLAVDDNGNVYVSGIYLESFDEAIDDGGSSFVLSFSTDGELRWARSFGEGWTTAHSIATSPAGDVYVVGSRRDIFAGTGPADRDAFIRAYTVDGEELWTHEFGGPLDDGLNAVAVDKAGNVTVVGYSEVQPEGQEDKRLQGLVISYDDEGVERWAAHVDLGSMFNMPRLWSVTNDAFGNVYVGGGTNTDSEDRNQLTSVLLAYSPDGEPLWVERADAETSMSTYVALAAVGESASFVAVGYANGQGEGDDHLVVKLLSRRTSLPEPVFAPGNEAVLTRAVEAGGAIHLEAGLYELAGGWALSEDLTLVGAGPEQTTVRFLSPSAVGAAIHWTGDGLLRLQGLRLEYAGEAPANVLTVAAGEAHLSDLVVAGGVTSPDDHSLGSGVVLSGSARAVLETSTLRDNDAHGVAVRGATEAVLEGNIATSNGWSGFALSGRSSVTLEGNTSEGNADHGVSAWGEAEVELVGNESRGNGWSGVAIFEHASGRLRSNESTANGHHGFAVWDQAHARIASSRAHHNGWSGVAAYGQASVEVRWSTLERNERRGMLAFESAHLRIERNHVRDNVATGIFLADDAGGEVLHNLVAGNGADGIACLGASTADIRDNFLAGNWGFGYAWGPGVGCKLGQNEFGGNRRGDSGAWSPRVEEG